MLAGAALLAVDKRQRTTWTAVATATQLHPSVKFPCTQNYRYLSRDGGGPCSRQLRTRSPGRLCATLISEGSRRAQPQGRGVRERPWDVHAGLVKAPVLSVVTPDAVWGPASFHACPPAMYPPAALYAMAWTRPGPTGFCTKTRASSILSVQRHPPSLGGA